LTITIYATSSSTSSTEKVAVRVTVTSSSPTAGRVTSPVSEIIAESLDSQVIVTP
jgi:hypothetical protein